MQTFTPMHRALALILLCVPLAASTAQTPSRDAVLQTMRRATDFMASLANRGGFVWLYTMELEPYGELKARPSMIWVEPPSTPSTGIMFLDAYEVTKDSYYLERAKQAAAALAAGQHESGGWNYFVDFDPAGLQRYYDEFFSKCWGWQEYLKKRGNCTFDDYSTTESTRFLLRLFAVTGDGEHQRVLEKAIDHILRAQYSHGGWPQRFPLDTDYSADATFNDDVTLDCILVLWEAAETLRRPALADAARKGMDFYVRAQLPRPQAGWAQQYGADLKPGWGRPFEIDTVCTPQTHSNILDLFRFYRMTGDAKYLEPIPAALEWLESARMPGAEGFTHTCFYEMGTNRPIYIKQTGTTVEDVRYEKTYEEEGCYPYAPRLTVPVDALRDEYERWKSTPPDVARKSLDDEARAASRPEFVRGHYLALALAKTDSTDAGIEAIVGWLDARGGWRDTISMLDPFQPFTIPAREIEAYTVGGYIARMYRMMDWLDAHK